MTRRVLKACDAIPEVLLCSETSLAICLEVDVLSEATDRLRPVWIAFHPMPGDEPSANYWMRILIDDVGVQRGALADEAGERVSKAVMDFFEARFDVIIPDPHVDLANAELLSWSGGPGRLMALEGQAAWSLWLDQAIGEMSNHHLLVLAALPEIRYLTSPRPPG